MEKISIKKILFYLTLIPYAAFVVICIFCAIIGYGYSLGKTAYGIVAIGNFATEAFANLVSMFIYNPVIMICISVLWIGFQIYYLITFKRDRKDKSIGVEEGNAKKISVKKIFFIISILCWCLYFATGVYAFFFGSNTGGGLFHHTREYGIDALVNTLFWNLISFTIIPVLPISLIYIIVYIFVKKREQKKSYNVNSN